MSLTRTEKRLLTKSLSYVYFARARRDLQAKRQ